MPPKRKAAAKTSELVEEGLSSAVTETTTTPSAEGAPSADLNGAVQSQTAALCTPDANANPSAATSPSAQSSPSELFSRLQATITTNTEAINEHVNDLLALTQHAESAATPLLMRVRFLEFIGRAVVGLRDNAALKKIVTSLVRIISGEDNTSQLLVAAVHCFAGLGPVSMLDKRWEYLSREGADVLMQIMIDTEAFPEQVRQAASKTLDTLTETAFRPVVTKLLHWVSDDREEDDAAQITTERRLALTRLSKLAFAPSMRHFWDDELQNHVLALLPRVLSKVDAREFSQLLRIAAALPLSRQQGQMPVLNLVLASVGKLDGEHALEAVAMTGRFFANAPTNTTRPTCEALLSALEQANLMSGAIATEGDYGVHHARVLLLAARVAPCDGLATLRQYVLQQLESIIGDGAELRCDLAVLESLLLAAVTIARRESGEVLQKLNEPGFNAAMTALTATATRAEQLARFAVKKQLQRSDHVAADDGVNAELLGALHTMVVIAGAFSAKHLPMAELKESYLARPPLPVTAHPSAPGAHALAGQGVSGAHKGQANMKRRRSPPRAGAASHGRRAARRTR